MSVSVGASLSRKVLVPVLAVGFFFVVSVAVSGVVAAQQTQTMNASWYGPGFEGATTASGEPFDPYGYTAAHKTLPFGTTMEVCYQGCVNVRINDRGPFVAGRDLDLAQGAADAIGLTAVGHATVNVTYTDGSSPAGPSSGGTAPTASQPATRPDPVVEPQRNQATETVADGQYAVEQQYENSASEEQYAVEEQYLQPKIAEAVAPAADLVPLAPPEPSQIEVAPLELATPGSTVERRIQLAVAAPPPNYTGALPQAAPIETSSVAQEAPDAEEDPEPGSVAAVAGLTVLPDTGGLPVMPLAGAALAISSLMVVGVRAFRR